MCGMESVKSHDNLIEIPTKNWRELRDLFALNWPKNHIAWHTINNYLNWFRYEPAIKNLKIYSLNGNWRNDGTFVVIVSRKKIILFFINVKISPSNKIANDENLIFVGFLSALSIHTRLEQRKIKASFTSH
jgi:hypothetical protein